MRLRWRRWLAAAPFAALLWGVPPDGAHGGDVERRARHPLRAGTQGEVVLDIELPAGWKLAPGAPLTYRLAADADRLAVREPEGHGGVIPPRVAVVVPVATGPAGETVLTVTLTFAYCREDERGVCLLGSVQIEQPLVLTPEAAPTGVHVSYRAPPPPPQFR
jgi:hypothetical protein